MLGLGNMVILVEAFVLRQGPLTIPAPYEESAFNPIGSTLFAAGSRGRAGGRCALSKLRASPAPNSPPCSPEIYEPLKSVHPTMQAVETPNAPTAIRTKVSRGYYIWGFVALADFVLKGVPCHVVERRGSGGRRRFCSLKGKVWLASDL